MLVQVMVLWAYIDPNLCRQMVSLIQNELIVNDMFNHIYIMHYTKCWRVERRCISVTQWCRVSRQGEKKLTAHELVMMTSSNGNIFRVTGHLCGEFTGHRWSRSPVNSPHKGQWSGALMFSLFCARINDLISNREAGYLRRRSESCMVSIKFKMRYLTKQML